MKFFSKEKSFTLIELLVVIVIIGILAGVIVVSTFSSINSANLAKGKVFSDSIKKNLFFDLVAEWTFDNALDIGKDEAGSNDLVFYNFSSKENSECLFSKCIYSEVASVSNYGINNSFPMPVSNFTIDVWVKIPVDVTYSYFLSYAVDGSDNEFLVGSNANSFTIYVNGTSKNFNVKINNNEWHNLVFVRKDNNVSAYCDGTLVDVFLSTGGNLTTGGSLVIGQDQDLVGGGFSASQAYKGYLDDLKIYSSASSFSQIKENYLSGLNKLLEGGNISQIEYNKRINDK